MKKYFFALLLCLLCCSSFSQYVTTKSLLLLPETKADFYEITAAGCKVLYLPMEFGKAAFTGLQRHALEVLANAAVARVDLVYSDFPKGQVFAELTEKRFNNLFALVPALQKLPGVEYRKIRQTMANSREMAPLYPHGFYIYYRPKPGIERAKAEVWLMKKELAKKIPEVADSAFAADTTATPYCRKWTFVYDSLDAADVFELLPGYIRTVKKMTIKQILDEKLFRKEDIYGNKSEDTVYLVQDDLVGGCDYFADGFSIQNITDTTVSAVLGRHKWGNVLIVCDVTGSMYPYTTQFLLWLKLVLTDNRQRNFVFFNDGDSKADHEKIIGKTGGIYPIRTGNYDAVEKMVEKAMTNGSGGDAPENNIEALLQAVKQCPACDSIVLIADNWAPVKDMSLLSLLNKPVKVIVCGVVSRLHTDYLNIARKTKGSIHLLEQDIYDLIKLKEGEKITIGGTVYKITGGEFVEEKARPVF